MRVPFFGMGNAKLTHGGARCRHIPLMCVQRGKIHKRYLSENGEKTESFNGMRVFSFMYANFYFVWMGSQPITRPSA